MDAKPVPPLKEQPVLHALLKSSNSSILYKVRTSLLDEPEDSPAIQDLHDQVRSSPVVQQLLQQNTPDGIPLHPYAKWQGAHWVLACLAEISYPPGDVSLSPLMEQCYTWLFSPQHQRPPNTLIIKGQEERVRRCASMEANAIWYSFKLGLADERTGQLVERLLAYQWPDGGWNCDKDPVARTSSFNESWLPLRAFSLHARLTGNRRSLAAAERAAEFFLQRRLFWRRRDGILAADRFLLLMYPYYWQYSLLPALKAIAEAGYINDPRCQDALQVLESKRLPDGGFPLERRNDSFTQQVKPRGTFADWGPSGKTRLNEWVTVDVLWVLKQAGRL